MGNLKEFKEQRYLHIANIDIVNKKIAPVCYRIKETLFSYGVNINSIIKKAKYMDETIYKGNMHWMDFLTLLKENDYIRFNFSFRIGENKLENPKISIFTKEETYKFNIGDIVYVKNIRNKVHVGVRRMRVVRFKIGYNDNLLVILSDIDKKENNKYLPVEKKENEHKYNLDKVFKNRKDAEEGRTYFDKDGNLIL